jgi:hypothetical protein
MGGSGSGKWCRWSKKAVVEGSLRIDVRTWQRQHFLDSTGYFACNWSNSGGETLASISVRSGPTLVVLMYRVQQRGGEWQDVEEPIQIVQTPCNYGGTRPWFICPEPSCGRRIAMLFITERNFRCRRCCKLSYGSQRESSAGRGLRRVQNIRGRLGGGPSLLERFPDKPKGMRWATYDGLIAEAQRAQMEFLAPMQKMFG